MTALAAVPASSKPFVLGLRRFCHYDDTFSLVSRPLADAVVFEWPHLRDFARLTTKYTMYGMVWPALVHWLRRVRGFEAELLASNPDLKTLIESEKLERYVQIIDPIDHRSGRINASARTTARPTSARRRPGSRRRACDLTRRRASGSCTTRTGSAATCVEINQCVGWAMTTAVQSRLREWREPATPRRGAREWILRRTRTGSSRNVTRKKFPRTGGSRGSKRARAAGRRRPSGARAGPCINQPVSWMHGRVGEEPASPRHRAGVASMAWRP